MAAKKITPGQSKDAQAPLESPDALADAELDPLRGAYFPRRYLTDFFQFISDHPADLEVLTYADFPWGDDDNYEANYPGEYKRWKDELSSGKRDPNKAYLVIQYDVDSRPERTFGLLREPEHMAVPANIMIFNKRVDRRRLKNFGEVGLTDYDLDEDCLRDFEKRGFVVGYHTNAHERAKFDLEKALDIFDADARELSGRFNLQFFSAHGGVPGPDGRNNRDLPFHPDWVDKLKWVHNGHSPHFDRQFSDGGHNSLKRDPEKRDIRDFIRTVRPGERCRILLHPQYYDVLPRLSPRFKETDWYRELLDRAARDAQTSLWADVKLGSAGGSSLPLTGGGGGPLELLTRYRRLSAHQKWWAIRKVLARQKSKLVNKLSGR